MPVTAQVRGLGGHRHDMTDAGVNVVGTAAADVALASLVGLHAADFVTRDLFVISHLGQPHSAHTSNANATAVAAATST